MHKPQLHLAGALVVAGCSKPPKPAPFTVYSLGVKGTPAAETFQGYPVLGKVELTDFRKHEWLIVGFHNCIAEAQGEARGIGFLPRFGMRTEGRGKTLDYLLAFDTLEGKVFSDDRNGELFKITKDPLPLFEKTLKEAGVPSTQR